MNYVHHSLYTVGKRLGKAKQLLLVKYKKMSLLAYKNLLKKRKKKDGH